MNTLVKLLVIDDDEVDKMHLKRSLKGCGFKYELTEYENIDAATDVTFFSSFDCIFLDYLLPGTNGLSLLKTIRDSGVKTPIVIVTSQGNESIAVELMKAGASDYIVKNEINGQSLGQVLRNMLYIRRITKEREEAELALRISESRLAEAQRMAKIGNWELDIVKQSLYCSEEIFNILETDEKIILPDLKFLLTYVHPEDQNIIEKFWGEALKGNVSKTDYRIITKKRSIRFAHAQGYAIKDPSGQVIRIVGTMQDITERKLAEQEISNAKILAENSMKVREVFLANMSHEIRTPMNAILGFTRLLYETNPSNEQKGFIDAIHFSGENLLVIINDILDLSKIQSGKMTIEKCEFNFHELLTGIIAIIRPKAQEKGLKLITKVDQHIPSTIKGDPVRLNQVLTNLISNAIKFTPRGSVTVEISSTTSENQDVLLEFKIKDTGIGIPLDKQSLIFENFIQASNDTTRKYGGTGLGLAIVKSLVELQDGKITVLSQPNAGSTFTVHLPFEKVEHEVVQLSPQVFQTNESFEQLRGVAVLVVEDNAVNQLLVKKVLQKTGCQIDVASNGIEAIAFIKSKKYDVVLMDIQMPEMDGYEATTYIRAHLAQPLCNIPIIAMTAHAFGSDITRCIATGMNDYISKPFKAEDLYSKMIKYLMADNDPKVIKLNQSDELMKYKIDLTPIYELGNGDAGFINEIVLVYDKQTPAFIEKLKGYTKSHNYDAIKSICHQIKSSYGILKMSELNKVLTEIAELLILEKPETEFVRITNMVNIIISLISAINEEVKRGLRRTG
jgi:signal transduction histidine kinase/DNA-binding response OmpR family regulator